jgi:hypothetical protein
MYAFIPKYETLQQILTDERLAALGDAYLNFIYSLALSKTEGRPMGAKVDNRVLSKALKKAGFRGFLPRRTNRHTRADAAEALIVYAWVMSAVTIEEGVNILGRHKDVSEGLCALLLTARNKLHM